ncbi:MAG TPA: hypothetical protein VGR22_01305 [Thermomicrobiales bacterium]|nr:hypothetical protein [Thermomicrobiales bacterium]
MAKTAGLQVDAERARRLRDELDSALDAVAALDDAIDASSRGTAGADTFDADWAGPDRENRRG